MRCCKLNTTVTSTTLSKTIEQAWAGINPGVKLDMRAV